MSCLCNPAEIMAKYQGFFTPMRKGKVDPEKEMSKKLKKTIKGKKSNESILENIPAE